MPLVATITPTEFRTPGNFVHAVYRAALDLGIPAGGAVILTTHMAHSTGYGRSADNYMLAGIKARGGPALCRGAAADPGYPYICRCSWERRVDGSYAAGCPDQCGSTSPPKCMYPFRAYRSVTEGVAAVVANLRQSRYTQSWALLVAGSTEYFRQIGYDGWYTGWREDPEGTYRRWLSTYAEVRRLLALPEPAGGGGVLWLAAGVGAVWWARKKGWI